MGPNISTQRVFRNQFDRASDEFNQLGLEGEKTQAERWPILAGPNLNYKTMSLDSVISLRAAEPKRDMRLM